MFQCTVLLNTDERKTPHINGAKTGVVLTPGMTWIATEYRTADNNGLGMWVKTPSGNWTAASYPNTVGGVKLYVRVQEIDPDPPLPPPDVLPLTVTIETEYHAPQTVTLLPK